MGAYGLKIGLILYIVLISLYKWAYARDNLMENENNIKAVCLVLHGLNLKPQKMDDWVDLLKKNGCHTIRMELSGHNGDNKAIKEVTAQMWRENFNNYAIKAQKEALKLNVPLYFLGFSLGGLLGLDWQAKYQGFKKMVLLAPALAVPWYASTLNLLNVFGKKMMLPSKSPKSYQSNKGVSLAAYEALFEIRDDLEKNHFKDINRDALVIMDKNDELVPFKKIRNIIEKNRLSRWNLWIVNNQFAYDNFDFRHLLVDQNAVGPKLWADMNKKVIEYLTL